MLALFFALLGLELLLALCAACHRFAQFSHQG